MEVNGEKFGVEYWPGDSRSGMFGGNSNWRGPIWLATNFLLIESLQRFHQYYGNEFKVRGFPNVFSISVAHVRVRIQIECPTGSGDMKNLADVAKEIQRRLISIFITTNGARPSNGGNAKMDHDPNFRNHILFHEVCSLDCSFD